MKNIFLCFILFLSYNSLFSQQIRSIPHGAQSLMISSDARASGLGDQGVATSPDAYSQHWNPAKYTFLENKSGISVSYTPWLQNLGVEDSFLANLNYYNIIDNRSSWSASFKYFTLGEIDLLNDPRQKPWIAEPNFFTLDGSYSLKLNKNFSMAVSARFISSSLRDPNSSLDSESTNTFAVDISGFFQSDMIAYNNFSGIWRAGFNISNLGPRMKYEDLGRQEYIPTNLKLGSSFDFIFDSLNKLSVNIEFNKLLVPSLSVPVLDNDNNIIGYSQPDVNFMSGIFKSFGDAPDGFSEEIKEVTMGIGLEYTYNDSFALRIGHFGENELKGGRKYITYGTGFSLNEIDLDLSYISSPSKSSTISPLDNTLRFSFTYNFM